ncbi:tumor necrosis factor receptor superfamily member 14 isoform X1 [Apodemus sylvaticus]|uniref:tumor necrosis factor receptor superfamily member 14 isoform X1 n=1 Tax=Apodemus sylvaticus TaxID=10129 RepID=UPI0022433567|nr:tumor necrosis factor receptor superfamily member 14 isoform X1 [Apodemus sylvaticus]XP_052034291.1 tumor necrosis factor receptor superfamily member 14 isoform X1 [Apodemus sylvaticus]XP_052034293.1 tumor necrosis factor receptor superfamily member 14 isoform X1 [Apodemus sylvaticus]
MEPLPGWGSSPWSQALTDNSFRLVLCVFLLNLLQHISALPSCRQEEFSVGDECCPMCNPGYHVKQVCSEHTGTVCAPCPPQTYTAHANGLSKCLPCGVCDPDMGLLTWQECSRWKDTVCRCIPGYFCETQDGEHCSSTCSPHNACAPGQRVQKRGTYSQDTVCAECLTGTFSLGGTQEECLPWTKCGAFQQEVTRGTSSTDTTCSFWVFYSVIFLVLMAIVGIGVFLFLKRRLRHTSPVATELEPFQQEQQENTIRFPVTEVGLAVTEEETASNCTQSG